MSEKKLRITLVRSPIGNTVRQKATVKGLGLGKLQSSVIQADTPSIRGMIAKVSHLVEVEEVES
jgi:large subunit ribosomal protein L30